MASPSRHSTETGQRSIVKLMIGALMFPLFMAIALPGVYLYAFHEPSPHGMNVEIVAADQRATELTAGLSAKMAPAFEVGTVADMDTARVHLTELSSRAAFDPATGELYVATAGSAAAEATVTAAFGAVADQLGVELQVRDVAPLPGGDRLGVSLMFVGLAAILAGFVTATVLNLAVPGLSLRAELGIIALMGLVAAVVTSFLAYSVYGALSGHLFAVAGLVWLATVTAGLLQSGGIKLIGPAMTLLSIALLVILGIPASGIAVPIDMTPALFAHLHSWLPTSAVLDALRRTIYFGGQGVAADLPVIGLWMAIGAGLIWLGTLRGGSSEPAVDPANVSSVEAVR